MYVKPDDDIYRVDAVWLGPPGATVPWRARYVAWGIGLVSSLLVLTVLRLWFPFGFFTAAWSIVIAIGITRLVGRKITHERPLRDVGLLAVRELTTPREKTTPTGGAADIAAVRVRDVRPRPKSASHPTQRQEIPRA